MQKASIENRAKAFSIDFLVAAVIEVILTLIIIFVQLEGLCIDDGDIVHILVATSVCSSLYILTKDCFKGRSIGKRIVGIAVRDNTYNNVPNVARLFVRNITYVVWPIELAVFFFGKSQRRLGDIITNTDVFSVSGSAQ